MIVKWSVWVCVVSYVMLTKKCLCATVLGNNNSVDIILGGIFNKAFNWFHRLYGNCGKEVEK